MPKSLKLYMAHNINALSIDAKFATSVSQTTSFPLNLVHQQTYSATLRAYKNRLDVEAPRLFEIATGTLDVPIRDFNPSTQRKFSRSYSSRSFTNSDTTGFERWDIKSASELRQHHGIRSLPATQNGGLEFTKPDPRCRAMYADSVV